MNKNNGKIIAFILAFSMILVYIPMDIVLANYQSVITSLKIQNTTPKNQATSDIRLTWDKPAISTRPDPNASDADKSAPHEPKGYEVYYRNGTKRESYPTSTAQTTTGPDATTIDMKLTLLPNSIYSFYVNPFHTHLPKEGTTSYRAPYETTPPITEVLNLTDITVKAESESGGFKLTWGNPTYMGANVFSGYRMQYATQSSVGTGSIPSKAPSIDVLITDPNLTFNTDGTVTYVFKTPNVSVGQNYAVKIEPLYQGTLLRSNSTSNTVTIGVGTSAKTYQIAYTPPDTHEYRANNAYIKPSLNVIAQGADNIKLYWNTIAPSDRTVTSVDIFSYENDDDNREELIGTIAGSNASTTNNWLLPTPKVFTSYKIVINFSDGSSMESNYAYWDPAFTDFDPYKPIIYQAEADIKVKPPSIKFDWQAFLRKPYSDEEKAQTLSKYENLYNDQAVSYRIWVTDDLNNLSNNLFSPNYLIDNSATKFQTSDIVIPNTTKHTLAYNASVNQYYSFNNNVAELKNIEGNKIYYIKIVATRDGTNLKSEPEFYSIYVPPTSAIDVNPHTMDTPPLRISKDSVTGADIVTDTSMQIEWDKRWYEVYNKEDDTWYSAIGKDKDGNIIFGKNALKLEGSGSVILPLYPPYIDMTQSLSTIKTSITTKLGVNYDIPTRLMDISNNKYEIFTVEYNYLELQGGYDTYYQTIKDSTLWHDISPNVKDDSMTYKVTTKEAEVAGPLLPNTSYVVYMRNYTIGANGERIYAYNQSYVVGNTIATPTDIDVTPTAQLIEAVSSTDTTVTFRWEYNDAFSYNFKYSAKTADYPAGGIIVENKDIIKNGEFKSVVVNGETKTYVYYTVENLFPKTVFYAWINASGLNKVSPWSTPASIATKDLKIPDVPHGLGPMGAVNVKIINENQNKKYKAIDENSIIIEWTKTADDNTVPKTGIVADDKGYGEEILFDALILDTYGVKFNNLNANTRYYFRVKSVVTATKNADSSGKYVYSYIISMADNEDFLDEIIFEVPLVGGVDDDKNTLVRESLWSDTVSLVTGKSDDEYDGEFDPDLYPLPETDFEIIYNQVTDELTYVFRGPGLDSTGKPNNGTDQRFISKVINNKIYDFAVDLTKYNSQDVSKRKVVIPYSIIKALENQKVTLTFKTGNMYTKVDLGMFSDAVKQNNVSSFNANSKAEIYIYEVNTLNGLLSYGQKYASKPQKISIRLNTGDRIINLDNMQKPLQIGLAIDNRYLTEDGNVNAYKQIGGNTTSWTPIISKYNSMTNKFNFDTRNVGTYSAIYKPVPTNTEIGTDSGSKYDGSMYSVNSFINITDMPYFNPSANISANQFNNIVYAVINDSPTVTMNKKLSEEAYTELGRGKLLVSGTYVTREKGIASLARLYELKTKENVKPNNELNNQGYSDYKTVDSAYSSYVNKAIEIGMIEGDKIRPKDNMTFGEFMYMLEAVVLDQ